MTCEGCVHTLERAVAKIDGVIVVKARLDPGSLLVRYDAGRTDVGTLTAAIQSSGFEVPGQMETSNA
jgi:copper chaperone CopZ